MEIAFEEIIKPLVVPKSIDLYIVFDSWWFSSDLFSKCLKLGHNIVCQIKSDKKVGINKDMYFQVRDLANQIEDKFFIKTTVTVLSKFFISTTNFINWIQFPHNWPVIDILFVLISCYLIIFALPLYCIAYAKSKTWKLQ